MKKTLLLLLTLLAGSTLAGAVPVFEASFDNGPEADFACGEFNPSYLRCQTDVMTGGISGNGLKIGPFFNVQTAGTTTRSDCYYTYTYPAAGNLYASSGAISFFVKPLDWDGKNNIDNKMFFQADGNADGHFGMVIYKVRQLQSLYIYTWHGEEHKGCAITDLTGWEQGEWHHIVCNWENDMMTFFVDGKHAVDFPFTPFPAEFEKFILGYLGWQHETGSSVIDELKIFDEPLSVEEVSAIYTDYCGVDEEANLRRGYLGIVRKPAAAADGRVSCGEYSVGANGFLVTPGAVFSPEQSVYYMSHDGEKLYIAVESNVQEDLQAKPQERDGQLWLEENVELHFGTPEGDWFQFIVTPADAIYDSCNGDMEWNSESFTCTSSVKDGIWVAEMSVDLKDLKITEGVFGINIARSFRSPRSNTCIGPVIHGKGFADRENFFDVRLLDKSYPDTVTAAQKIEDGEFVIRFAPENGCNEYEFTAVYREYGRRKVKTAVRDDSSGTYRIKLPGEAVITVAAADKEGEVIYANDFVISEKGDVSPVNLQYLYTEMEDEQVIFCASSTLPASKRGAIKLVWKDAQGSVVDEEIMPVAENGINFKFAYAAGYLPVGFYTVEGIWLSPDGEEVPVFLEHWRKPEIREIPDYFALEEIKIQAPWQPLMIAGSEVSALTQQYDFGNAVLFEQVTALERDLLAEPCYLEVNGRRAEAEETPVIENYGDYAIVTQFATADELEIITGSLVEFDGTIKVRMTLIPPAGGCAVDSVKLVIPFDDSKLKYVHGNMFPGNGSGMSGLLVSEPWRENIFRNFAFWIGDEKTGFSWVQKNAANWHCQDTDRSLEVLLQNGIRTVNLNFADTAFFLTEPRTIEFAVMATPPRHENLKIKRTRMVDWRMWTPQISAFFDYLEPEFMHTRESGDNFFWYSSFGTSPHSPDWNYYHKEWHHGSLGYFDQDFAATSLEVRNRDHYISTCMSVPSLLDFKIRELENFIVNRDFVSVRNLYFDLVAWAGCSSEDHGCAWVDDFGRKWRSFDWEGRQIFIRRVRAALLAHNPDGMISLHTHNQRIPMVHAYGDVFVGGEDFVSEVGEQGNYYGFLNSHVLRSYSVPYGMGGKCVFIPQFERSLLFVKPGTEFDVTDPVNIKAMRHLLVMLFANDIDFWYLDNPQSYPLWELQAEFGWDENTLFYPSWNADGLFRIAEDSSGGKAIASVFKRDSRFLLILLNDSPRAADMKIELDFDRLLGKNPAMVRDCFVQGRQHSINGNTLSVNIDPYEFTVLWFE